MNAAPEVVKACCAGAYASDAVRWLLGERLHPGGEALTHELIGALRLGSAEVGLDVACGPGASSLQLARETECAVVGVDLSAGNVAVAGDAAAAAGLGARVRFVQGDAEALPLADASVDGALCECAFCTFPNKRTAASELARVLRPGRRLALADLTAELGRLPPELRTLDAWVACVADARPLDEVAALLEDAGFVVEWRERRDEALVEMLDRIDARLRLARALRDGLPEALRAGAGRGLELVSAARAAVSAGILGYGIVVARRLPTP